MIAIALERGSHRFEWLAKRRDGSEFPVEVLLTAIPFQKDKYFTSFGETSLAGKKQNANSRNRAQRKTHSVKGRGGCSK